MEACNEAQVQSSDLQRSSRPGREGIKRSNRHSDLGAAAGSGSQSGDDSDYAILQPTNKEEEETRVHPPGEELIEKAMAAQHWVAIRSRRT